MNLLSRFRGLTSRRASARGEGSASATHPEAFDDAATTIRPRRRRLTATFAAVLVTGALIPAGIQLASAAPAADERVVVDVSFTDLAAVPDGFTPVSGTWVVEDGVLKQTANGGGRIQFGEHLRDFRIEATMSFDWALNESRWLSVGLDAEQNFTNWSQAAMRYNSTGNSGVEFAQNLAGSWAVPDKSATQQPVSGLGFYEVEVEVRGQAATLSINDEVVLTTERLWRSNDGVQGFLMDNARASFKSVKVTELGSDPAPTTTSAPTPTSTPTASPAPSAPTEPTSIDFGQVTQIPNGWEPLSGQWQVANGALQQTSFDTSGIKFGQHLPDFRVEARLRFDEVSSDSRWLGVGLDVVDGSAWTQAAMRFNSAASNGVEFANWRNGWSVPNTASADRGAASDEFTVTVEVHGSKGTYFVNGKQVLTTTKLQRSSDGTLGFTSNGAKFSVFSVEVTPLEPAPLTPFVTPGEAGQVVAHRGNSAFAPENTLMSLNQAHRLGADMLEFDLCFTSDNVPVLSHDGTVDRTTDGTGMISQMTLAEIKQLDAGATFDPIYAGTRIPTFEEVLTYAQSVDALIVPEIKGCDGRPESRADVERVIDMIEQYGYEKKTIIQSFSLNVVQMARDANPSIARGLLSNPHKPEDVAGVVDSFRGDPGTNYLLPYYVGITPEYVRAAHAAGAPVVTWTVDNANDWANLTAAGVDGIMTNRPSELIGWKLRYNQENPGTPAEPEPTATQPEETSPAETEPAETEPVETEPTETAPVETAPVETAPVETQPTETSPVETEPGETQATTRPDASAPVSTEPAATDPATTPATPRPTAPTSSEPVIADPSSTQTTSADTGARRTSAPSADGTDPHSDDTEHGLASTGANDAQLTWLLLGATLAVAAGGGMLTLQRRRNDSAEAADRR